MDNEGSGVRDTKTYIYKDVVISKVEKELDKNGGIMHDHREVLDYLKKKYIDRY